MSIGLDLDWSLIAERFIYLIEWRKLSGRGWEDI